MNKRKKNIVWLASYPKSGNTWVRIFLSNILSESNEPVNINEINLGQMASHRANFEKYTGVESSDLTQEEIDNFRPHVYRRMSDESDNLLFIKVHDAWQLTPAGEPMFPKDITLKVIYIVRHPYMVTESFAHHLGSNIDKSGKVLLDSSFCFANKINKLNSQLKQKLGSWEEHVKSWTENSGLPVHVIQYESLSNKPFEEFSKLCNTLQIQASADKNKSAIANSSLFKLKEQELKNGFNEKPIRAHMFFRAGNEILLDSKDNFWKIPSALIKSEICEKYNYKL